MGRETSSELLKHVRSGIPAGTTETSATPSYERLAEWYYGAAKARSHNAASCLIVSLAMSVVGSTALYLHSKQSRISSLAISGSKDERNYR